MEMHVPDEVIDVECIAGMFPAPAIHTPLDGLFGEYRACLKQISEIAETVAKSPVIYLFLEGLRKGSHNRYPPSPTELFDLGNAKAALDSEFWQRAMNLTGVLEVMPAAKRNDWNNLIRELNAPDFEEDSVRATIMDLLNSRSKFFAEKVDGIFQSLSRKHITNCPEGFANRMIVEYMINSHGSVSYERVQYLHDLRVVIASFMGREACSHGMTGDLVRGIKNDGKWVKVDGGAFRIRMYKVGTCHIEIHPEMAWRLNKVLAFLYPLAITSQLRYKPAKRFKEYELRTDTLSQSLLNSLDSMLQKVRSGYNYRQHQGMQASLIETSDKNLKDVERVLTAIGGVETRPKIWSFEYDITEVVKELLWSALLPDAKSHQFYPTNEVLAREVVDLAEIGDHDTVLEPSAGSAGIARFLPKDQTQCVEVSALHARVLGEMGFTVDKADFLTWEPGRQFDRICMNPPFSEGRAKAHLIKAVGMLAKGGRLVAVLPGSMRNTEVAPGMTHTWGPLRTDEFKDASVSVTVLVLKN